MTGKIVAYVLAWMAALFATDPTFGVWSLVWMFPIGLFAFFFPERRQDGGWTVLAVVLAIYIAQAFFYFRARTLRAAIPWFAVLVLLLICNAAGCRAMLHAH